MATARLASPSESVSFSMGPTEVSVPAADIRGDVFIPYEIRLHDTIELIKAVFAEEASHGFMPSDETLLCDADTGAVYNVNLTPEEIGLENGSRLMLM